jgi:hypothetical protein
VLAWASGIHTFSEGCFFLCFRVRISAYFAWKTFESNHAVRSFSYVSTQEGFKPQFFSICGWKPASAPIKGSSYHLKN